MDSLIWRLKQLVRKFLPYAIIGVVLYGGYNMVARKGVFRHGVGAGVNRLLRKVPYFGSRFRHHSYRGRHYSYSGKRKYRHGRRTRHSRRHRRYR